MEQEQFLKQREKWIEELQAIVARHNERQGCYRAIGLPDQVASIIGEYERAATDAIAYSKRFGEDMLTWLRALACQLQIVGNGATHGEKAARLRGLVELVETAIQKVRESSVSYSYSYRHAPDLFTCDFPTRDLLRSLRETEHYRDSLRTELAQLNAKHPEEQATDDCPV